MPVRNGAPFIGAALRSVITELEGDDELIVVNDGSTDGSERIVRAVAPNALCLEADAPGVSGARNTGLRAARGELIAFLDCDDLWPPGRQRVLRDRLEPGSGYDACAGRIRVRAETAEFADDLAALDATFAPSILMTCLYRRELIEKVGFFDEGLKFGEDLDFHWRLVETGMKIALSDCDALIYRRHSGNATNFAPPKQSIILKLLARRVARRRAWAAAQGGNASP